MHLYRIITEVCAGPDPQPGYEPGQAGLATVWVQSDSEDNAFRHARQVFKSRRYQSVGELTIFQEESTPTCATAAANSDADSGDSLAAGYTSMKEKALARGDGLFEIWFPGK